MLDMTIRYSDYSITKVFFVCIIYQEINPHCSYTCSSSQPFYQLLTSILSPAVSQPGTVYHLNTAHLVCVYVCVQAKNAEIVCGAMPAASLGQDITEVWNTSNVLAGSGGHSDSVCLSSGQAADRKRTVFMFTSDI